MICLPLSTFKNRNSQGTNSHTGDYIYDVCREEAAKRGVCVDLRLSAPATARAHAHLHAAIIEIYLSRSYNGTAPLSAR